MGKAKSPPTIAQVIARRRARVLERRGWRSLFFRVLFLGLIGVVLFTQVFLVTRNAGQDMFPALKDGDLCVVFRTQAQALMQEKYVRGDIVAYRIGRGEGEGRPPGPVRQWLLSVMPDKWIGGWLTGEDPGERRFGRVVAAGGDVVTMSDSGALAVNGTPQSGEIMYPTYARGALSYPYRVPEGCVYVLGDYRTNTADSRDYGPIPLEDVEGKVITILRRRGL